MSDPANLLTIKEYEKLPYVQLGEANANRLEKVMEQRRLPMFRFFRNHVQAQQYVGIVKAGDLTIQILPKVYEEDSQNLGFLVFMLSYTRRLKIQQFGAADYESLNGSFLEIWIRHFAIELNRLLRRQLIQSYEEVEEPVTFLRGKLLVERELDGSGTLYARYSCRYEIFTADHLLNQVLKFCNALLLRQTQVQSNRTILQENDVLLADVTYRPLRVTELEQIHLNRLNRHYEPILGLCRLLLSNSTLDLRAGRISQLAIVFDMNRLFEEFVAAFLIRNRERIDLGDGRRLIGVSYQHYLGKLFEEFNMHVDLILTDNKGESFLVDTKYKVLNTADRHAGLSQMDFFQMYAYGNAGKQPYDRIVLLYPTTSDVRRRFHQKGMRLYVRQFDPRSIYDAKSGSLNESAVAVELTEALSGLHDVDM